MERGRNPPWRTLAALVLFGAAFGYVEAAVVIYLRELYEPLALQLDPDRVPDQIFPLITLEQLAASGTGHLGLLKIEVIREAATIAVLAAVGLAAGWNFNTCFASFVVAFGVWDVCYYAFLKVLVDWPASLLEWDLLFLIPLPWVGPVMAPVLVAISMVVAGTLLLWRESAGRPMQSDWQHWSIMVGGGLIIIVAFCWDGRRVMAGGMPQQFPWSLFLVGATVGWIAFARALTRSPLPRSPRT